MSYGEALALGTAAFVMFGLGTCPRAGSAIAGAALT
jgi:hypothetical protein